MVFITFYGIICDTFCKFSWEVFPDVRSWLKNGVLVAQTCDITYEKVAAFRLVEWYDDLFMEVL